MLPGPGATARSCRGAYRSRQSPAKPEHPTGPGSSAVHNLEHPRERRRVYPRIDDDPTPAPDDDLHAPSHGRPGSRPTLGDDHRRHKARRRPFRADLLGTKRSSPRDQHRSGDPVSACRRRSEEHTSELQSHSDLVCRLLLEKKKKKKTGFLLVKKKKEIKTD